MGFLLAVGPYPASTVGHLFVTTSNPYQTIPNSIQIHILLLKLMIGTVACNNHADHASTFMLNPPCGAFWFYLRAMTSSYNTKLHTDRCTGMGITNRIVPKYWFLRQGSRYIWYLSRVYVIDVFLVLGGFFNSSSNSNSDIIYFNPISIYEGK